MIAYTLLCGYSPFRSDDKNELVKETTRGKIMFHERYWKKVSETGESLNLGPCHDFFCVTGAGAGTSAGSRRVMRYKQLESMELEVWMR